MAQADLAALLARRQIVEEELIRVEKQIYFLEQSYLEDTRGLGNAVRGYDDLLSAMTDALAPRTGAVADQDRLFSLGSSSGRTAASDNQ